MLLGRRAFSEALKGTEFGNIDMRVHDALALIYLSFSFTSDFLMGWKLSQSVRDQGGMELCAGIPEDPSSKARPRHTHHLCQRGPRTAHLHRLVQCLGSS